MKYSYVCDYEVRQAVLVLCGLVKEGKVHKSYNPPEVTTFMYDSDTDEVKEYNGVTHEEGWYELSDASTFIVNLITPKVTPIHNIKKHKMK